MMIFFSIFNKWERFVIAGLLVIVLSMSFSIWLKDHKIKNLQNDLNKSNTALSYVKNALKQNAVYYDAQLKEYRKIKPRIIVKHNTIYKEIENSNADLKTKVFEYVKRVRDEDINGSN